MSWEHSASQGGMQSSQSMLVMANWGVLSQPHRHISLSFRTVVQSSVGASPSTLPLTLICYCSARQGSIGYLKPTILRHLDPLLSPSLALELLLAFHKPLLFFSCEMSALAACPLSLVVEALQVLNLFLGANEEGHTLVDLLRAHI